jgi:hypothetical protein
MISPVCETMGEGIKEGNATTVCSGFGSMCDMGSDLEEGQEWERLGLAPLSLVQGLAPSELVQGVAPSEGAQDPVPLQVVHGLVVELVLGAVVGLEHVEGEVEHVDVEQEQM